MIRTKGGWGNDDDIEDNGEEEGFETDKKWLDKMWRRGGKKKKEKSIEEYKVMALKFKQRMEDAADDDESAHSAGKPALEKLALLPEVQTEMRKHELQVLFLEECGILHVFKRWLGPLNGKTFPNHNLKLGMLTLLDAMTDPDQGGSAVNPDQVKESGIGGIVMLYKMRDKDPAVRNTAQRIVDRWSRPVLGTGTHNHTKLHDVKEKERRDGSVQRISKLTANRVAPKKNMESTRNKEEEKLEAYMEERTAKAKIGDAVCYSPDPPLAAHTGLPVAGLPAAHGIRGGMAGLQVSFGLADAGGEELLSECDAGRAAGRV